MKEITVELTDPVMYSPGTGGEIEGSHITISQPTGKIAHLVSIIKAEIGAATTNAIKGLDLESAIENARDDSAEKADDESSPEDIGDSMFAMLTSGGADMQKVMVTFKEILVSSAQMAGEKKITAPLYDRMSYTDIERSLKMYIGTFMTTSGS